MKLFVQGIGLVGPAMASWATSQDVLKGAVPLSAGKTQCPPPARLPPAERRRAGEAIKVALAVADEAVAMAGLDPSTLATVFTSSSGEGSHCHAICEALASPDRLVSPTRFANSVHNAPAGYWHIAVASRAPSNSLCAFDGSFAAGLIEAGAQAISQQVPVLLVANDTPYPQPLQAKRPLPDSLGIALILSPETTPHTLAELLITLAGLNGAEPPTPCSDALMEQLRAAIPAARGLPLLQALARGAPSQRVLIESLPGQVVQVDLRRLAP